MPIIKSAKKKLKQDIKRRERNSLYEQSYKKIILQIKKTKEKNKRVELVKKAYSLIDKAAKKKVIHKNKAARLKSKICKFLK